jgi:uncharacterized protein (TIGR02186 family)
MIRWLALPALLSCPALAEEKVVSGLSRDQVAITANFDGSDILIYGAVKREAAIPSDSKLDVIVTVEGPLKPIVVRRKSREAGLWINTDSVTVDSAPSFYEVATTGPLYDVLSYTEDLRHRISLTRMIRSVGAPSEIADADTFKEALMRIRGLRGDYRLTEGAVELAEETLFRADIDLPANLTEGRYTARIFLLRDRKVVDVGTQIIRVRKVGLERALWGLANSEPALYGLLSLIIAVAAGWAASAAFRFIRN